MQHILQPLTQHQHPQLLKHVQALAKSVQAAAGPADVTHSNAPEDQDAADQHTLHIPVLHNHAHITVDDDALMQCERAASSWLPIIDHAIHVHHTTQPPPGGFAPLLHHSKVAAEQLGSLVDVLSCAAAGAVLDVVQRFSHDPALLPAIEVVRVLLFM